MAMREDRDGEWYRDARRRGELGSLKAWTAEPTGWSRTLAGLLGPVRQRIVRATGHVEGPAGALLQGIVAGDRSRVRGTPAEEQFRLTGTAHLLAVSGTHLAIVALLVAQGLQACGVRRSRRLAAVLLFGFTYAMLTGAQASSMRAWVMSLAVVGAVGAGRRSDAVSALALAVVGILASAPAQAFDLGLRLSASAVGGLIVFCPLATAWLRSAVPARFGGVAGALAAPVVAQLATLPASVPLFHVVPLVGPVANLCIAPFASLGLGIGLVGAVASQFSAGVGAALMQLAGYPLAVVVALIERFAGVPAAAIAVGGTAAVWAAGCGGVAVLAWIVWPRPRRLLARGVLLGTLLALVFTGVGWRTGAQGAEMIVLDVGQGDAVLIRDGASAVLVDTGPDPGVLREAMGRYGVRRLDAVLLTHPHDDHTGGMEGLDGVVRVGMVCLPTLPESHEVERGWHETLERRETVRRMLPGDRLRVGRFTLDVLWPDPENVAGMDTNNTSLIVNVRAGDFSAVLTGDAEAAPQHVLADQGLLTPCDVLKVPHHGSDEGIAPDALAIWSPRLAVVSVGESNDYGHPAASTMRQLEACGARVLRTDREGDVRIRVESQGYRVLSASPLLSPRSCATIGRGILAHARNACVRSRRECDVCERPFRPEVCLFDPWSRGLAVRPGGRAAKAAPVGCRGP
jgi:competence protein ComEC